MSDNNSVYTAAIGALTEYNELKWSAAKYLYNYIEAGIICKMQRLNHTSHSHGVGQHTTCEHLKFAAVSTVKLTRVRSLRGPGLKY